MTELANITKGQAMYSQNWVSFAYARDPNPKDQCVANAIATKLGANGPDSQCARRSDAGGFLPFARPCSLKDEEFRT